MIFEKKEEIKKENIEIKETKEETGDKPFQTPVGNTGQGSEATENPLAVVGKTGDK